MLDKDKHVRISAESPTKKSERPTSVPLSTQTKTTNKMTRPSARVERRLAKKKEDGKD